MTIRVFEAFAGVGSQRMALRNLGIDHEVVAIAEIDKFAIKSYEAIHGETNNLGDISQIETADIPDHDLFTYSFPCQDISVAGKGLGLDEGSDTRSGLLWECQKVIYGKRPKYLLLENVKNLVGKKHKHNFDRWLEWLEKQGYTNYYKILNAKDYGIPQNRERVFVVSILGYHTPYKFPEPIELELRLKDVLEEVVDEKLYLDTDKAKKLIATVTDKHDIKEATPTDGGLKKPRPKEVANAIIARYDAGISNQQSTGTMVIEPNPTRLGGIFDKDGKKHQAGAIWDKNQVSPTLDTMQGGWRQPSVVVDNPEGIPIKNAAKKGYINAYDGDGVDLAYPTSKTRRGRVQKGLSQTLDTSDSKGVIIAASRGRNPENPSDRTVGSPTEQRLEINKQGTSNTITTVQKDNYVVEAKKEYGRMGRQAVETLNENNVKYSDTINPFNKRVSSKDGISPTLTTRPEGFKTAILPVSQELRIRKLTPLETWRLMGFSDDDFHKAEEVNSNSQLYKQAGNSIVVDVLEGIFKQLLEEK